MDIYVHWFPARFIFFINMLVIQVQALQNTNMDSRDYIILIKIWKIPKD